MPDLENPDERRRIQEALMLNQVIRNVLNNTPFDAFAEVSLQRLLDVIQRWEHDMRRLEAHQADGINPIKFIAYQAFWIRKIKPISNAYRKADLELAKAGKMAEKELALKEIHDINERMAVNVAVKQLIRLCDTGKFPTPSTGPAQGIAPVGRAAIRSYINSYLRYPKKGDGHGTTYANLLYNMRYRTFGPHHLTHILDQMVFGATLIPADGS